jgi:hypothetical protein
VGSRGAGQDALYMLNLRSLRISVFSALDIFRDYGYAESTEIRRDRREEFKFPQGGISKTEILLAQR